MTIRHYVSLKVCGVSLPFEECYGSEYSEHDLDNFSVITRQSGWPFLPFKYEKIISEECAYVVDNREIVWILEKSDPKDTGFERVQTVD